MVVFFKILFTCLMTCSSLSSLSQQHLVLENDSLSIEWQNTNEGYSLSKVVVKGKDQSISLNETSGSYSFLYSDKQIPMQPDWEIFDNQTKDFPDSSYLLIYKRWLESLSPVAMNTAGERMSFFPQKAYQEGNKVVFEHKTAEGTMRSIWQFDEKFGNDILVDMLYEASKPGYYSFATPIIFTVDESDLKWGMIPGQFQGNKINENLVLSYAYGQGIPNRPVIVRDRTTTTLSPLIQSNQGVTIAVIPSPGTGRDPWADNESTQNEWDLGLSLMTKDYLLSPIAYHPVLGQKGSFMNAGEKKLFSFRYIIKEDDWYNVYKHAIYDIYKFPDFLPKKRTKKSLTDRIWGMFDYVRDDSTSLWHTFWHKGLEIGAQEYNGPVVGSKKDAAKNSDYGAMWMLASLTNDSLLLKERLPYARNFKIAQQESEDKFFKGAASGQYYLRKSKRFTEEWGDYSEPIALTYYMMLDIGNILLFNPNDRELKTHLRLAADKLLNWQKPDGSWAVAYDHKSDEEIFKDLKDLRPTFYGMLVAYKIFGDKKYLTATEKGAKWFIKNAVDQASFLGVCGDFRFLPDFATGQSVQALLDLYDITSDNQYLDAALRTSRIYTASIYTQPMASNAVKYVKGKPVEDWEISQVGLSFEHGGTIGSAAKIQGPILLASHAGMFVRLFMMTGDSLYIDMARAGVWGRDAFVNKSNDVASYYWNGLDNGPGKFPHHAWWQIGWITDYLISELTLRSEGNIQFPAGFITPKVGPHKTYGFKEGTIYNQKVGLMMKKGLVNINDPYIEYLVAKSEDDKKVFVMLLNNSTERKAFELKLNLNLLENGKERKAFSISKINPQGKSQGVDFSNTHRVDMESYGLSILEIKYK